MREEAPSQMYGWENWDSEGDIDQSRLIPPGKRVFDFPGPPFKFTAPIPSYCTALNSKTIPGAPPGPCLLWSSISFQSDLFLVLLLFLYHWETPCYKAEFWNVISSNHGCWDLFFCGEDQPTALKPWLLSWRGGNQTLSSNGARMSAPRAWELHLHCCIPIV